MPDLTSAQLQAIQQLITDPLRAAVRAEMQAGHDRLASAVEKVADQLASHMTEALNRDRAHDHRIEIIEQRITRLEHFRGRVLIVYGALTMLLSFAWTMLEEYLPTSLRRR